MSEEISYPKYIFGLHEPGGEWLMEEKDKHGWILFTHGLGHDPSDQSGHDYRRWTDRGFGAIARLNHGYGSAGDRSILFTRFPLNFVPSVQYAG